MNELAKHAMNGKYDKCYIMLLEHFLYNCHEQDISLKDQKHLCHTTEYKQGKMTSLLGELLQRNGEFLVPKLSF